MNQNPQELNIFQKYVPEKAALYCHDLWTHYGFRFKITRSRKTKLGDYRYVRELKRHIITVNHDLNPFQFLVTYIHEVAHLITFEKYQHSVKPHGAEWKSSFRELMKPVITPSVFPVDLIEALNKYISNPKASSCADPALFRAMSVYDENVNNEQLLSDIGIGQVFKFQNRYFQKELTKRTRSVCLELRTGKKFLIPEVASVEPKSPDQP